MKQNVINNDEFFEKLRDLHTLAEIEKLLEQVQPLSSEFTDSLASENVSENVEENVEDSQKTEE